MDWQTWLCIGLIFIGIVMSIVLPIIIVKTIFMPIIPDNAEVHSVNGVIVTIYKEK